MAPRWHPKDQIGSPNHPIAQKQSSILDISSYSKRTTRFRVPNEADKNLGNTGLTVTPCVPSHTSNAQATSTASQPLQLSAFVAGSGTFTDLEGGKNGSFTAGVDLTFLNVPHVRPSLEIRGSYPIDQGHIR